MIKRLFGLAPLLFVLLAHAQYPSRPVHAIIPNGAGSPPDLLARAISQPLSQALGQPVVVDNRVGANGIVAIEAVVHSPPDGYTVCITQSAPISLNPYFYSKLPYEPLRDLAPVVNIGVVAATIIVSSSAPLKSMRGLIDAAKAKPGSLVWATWGAGSFSDLYRAWAEHDFGVSFLTVPYKTSTHAVTALISGEAQVMLHGAGEAMRLSQAGKIRVLGTIGPTRFRGLPDVPSFAELGYDMDFRGWVGVFAPVGTPREAILKLNAELNRIIADPSFDERFLEKASIERRGGTPEEFGAFLKKDRETAGRLVKLANIKPE